MFRANTPDVWGRLMPWLTVSEETTQVFCGTEFICGCYGEKSVCKIIWVPVFLLIDWGLFSIPKQSMFLGTPCDWFPESADLSHTLNCWQIFFVFIRSTFPTPYPSHVYIKIYIFCMCWISLNWNAWIRNISGISYFFQVLWNMWDIREWINSKHEISLYFIYNMCIYLSI